MVFLETNRLYLRKIQAEDYKSLCEILQDTEVMYAWEDAFSDEEVLNWINENLMRYYRDGYSYWAVIEKSSNNLVGVTGLISELADNEKYVGIGYIYNKSYWNIGYAFEGALRCIKYGFDVLHLNEIIAQIRPENIASKKVAKKLNMTLKKEFVKNYKGKEMLHLLYSLTK